MKKLLAAALIAAASIPAYAYTFWYNGILMGTVCRNGAYYTSYPRRMAQPVGSSCPVRDPYGNPVVWGVVTDE